VLRLRLGISSCLLGNTVRYDGGHKRDRFLADELAQFVEWVPVCPEVEAGLGIPRPALRLVRDGARIRVRETASGEDHTRALERASAARVRALRGLELDGYVLKKGSPSCGLARIKVWPSHDAPAMPSADGRGVFARMLCDALPNLPIEDEGRLQDPRLRESFLERIFAHARLRALFSGRWTAGQVVAFHTAHKLQVMAHSNVAYRALGRRVAAVKSAARAEFRDTYTRELLSALAAPATLGRNTNVLQHAAGHLKNAIDGASRQELADLIHDYQQGLVPLIAPITLLAHHVRRCGIAYLAGQTFLFERTRAAGYRLPAL
jgi:uncharacterized protein YbgA (DUF1722 family)/uncharacterized protein YbbK (DUF523 family)